MTGLVSGLLVLSIRHKLVWGVRTIAMNGIDVDLQKGKMLVVSGPLNASKVSRMARKAHVPAGESPGRKSK